MLICFSFVKCISSFCRLTMPAKGSASILTKLRALMKNNNFVSEPLQAYIIPTGDAHQV